MQFVKLFADAAQKKRRTGGGGSKKAVRKSRATTGGRWHERQVDLYRKAQSSGGEI